MAGPNHGLWMCMFYLIAHVFFFFIKGNVYYYYKYANKAPSTYRGGVEETRQLNR